MPEWKMTVINPTKNFDIKTVTIRVKKGEEGNIKVGLKIIAPILYTDDSYRNHNFRITKITSASKRTGEIEHLGVAFERLMLTPDTIMEIDFEITHLSQVNPSSIALVCSHCGVEIVPKNFGQLICCPKCGKPYNPT